MKKIIIDKKLKESLLQFSYANVLNGGITQMQAKLSKTAEGYHAHFKVAAAHEDTFKVLLKDNQLEIYRTFRIDNLISEPVELSALISLFMVPNFVDIKRLEATFQEGGLKLFAPFKEEDKRD